MDKGNVTPHKGELWAKVQQMDLPEKALVESFDSEEDFANYMGRKPVVDFDEVKRTQDGAIRTADDLRAKSAEMEDEEGEHCPSCGQRKDSKSTSHDHPKDMAALKSKAKAAEKSESQQGSEP